MKGVELGLDVEALAIPWRTVRDLCVCLVALEWPWLDGHGRTFHWGRQASDLLDGTSNRVG